MKDPFHGSEEHREVIDSPFSIEVYEQIKGLEVIFEKKFKGKRAMWDLEKENV